MTEGEFKKRIEQLKNTHIFASEVAPHTFPEFLSEQMNKALDDVYTIIDEAKKEFPVPFVVLRFKTSKGLGLGNVNTFELRKWVEKWLGDE